MCPKQEKHNCLENMNLQNTIVLVFMPVWQFLQNNGNKEYYCPEDHSCKGYL
jgi:hypothetical protein